MDKEVVKSQNRTKIFVAIIGLIGVLAGTFGMKMYNEHYGVNIVPEDNMAYVEKQGGIFIFFRSRPHGNDYISLGKVNTNAIFRAIENTEGKKNFGDILKSIGSSLANDFSFDNRLDIIIEKTKEEIPEVEGIIFSEDLTECEAIKF